MASVEDVQKLAVLARIEVASEELPKFVKEFDGILAYVGQLDTLSIDTAELVSPVRKNVMRDDREPHEAGAYTQALTEQFPAREGNYLSVKQIISHD